MNTTKYKLTISALAALCLILAFVGFGQTPNQTISPEEKAKQAQNLLIEASLLFVEDTSESYKAAFVKFEKARLLYQELGSDYKKPEAVCLNALGVISSILGKSGKAIEYYNQALPLLQAINDKQGEAKTYSFIGTLYSGLGDFQKALDYYKQSNLLLLSLKDNKNVADILFKTGEIYSLLNERQKALESYNQALAKYKEILETTSEATIDIPTVLFGKMGVISTLDEIGTIYLSMGKFQEAFENYNQALLIAKAMQWKIAIARELNSIGFAYSISGKPQEALDFLQQALQLYKSDGSIKNEARVLSDLMSVWNSLNNPRTAIFYGKQSVNKYQELRQAIQELDKKIQKTYLKTVEDTYRKLADILVAEGRLFEAQQVLAMLKEDEYFGYVRRDADEIKKLASRADLRADERVALLKYETLAGKVTEYGTQFVKLEDLKNKQGAGFAQQAEYDDLKTKLDAANKAFRIFLDKELVAEFSKKETVKEIKEDRALQTKLQEWGNGTVALYTVAGDDRYRVILTTPKTQTDGKTEIKIADLNRKIFEFRAALQNPLVDPRPLGKELYDILIKPIEKDLLAAEAKTLVWSLDGTLRYIPFAALSPDGIHYLAEKYQTVVVTSTTRQSLVAETNPNWRLLGAGVTKESRLTEPNGTEEIFFSRLPGVESELLNIVSNEDAAKQETGLMTGKRLIDDGFNLTALENGMSQRVADKKPKYNVIHLATHFRLGGDTAKSFLLMGNNQALTLEKVSDDTALNFGDVELVTLSACNTGFGTTVENKTATKEQERKLLEANNGAEVDSLATFIELRGAKAVLASLWAVADESTQMLMSEFYRLRKENPKLTKADAMQFAQQAMISGKLKSSSKTAGCRSDILDLDGSEQTAFKCDKDAPFSHPYFWSPFVLIGNWR